MSRLCRALLLATAFATNPGAGFADTVSAAARLPTGQRITPTASPGSHFQTLNPGLPDHPEYRAGQANKVLVSPDQSTLLVMTSGYNNLTDSKPGKNFGQFEPSASFEYIFVYDIKGAHKSSPDLQQVIKVPDTFLGLVFSPDGSKFYASGGGDDRVYVYGQSGGAWSETAAIPLGHLPVANTPDNGGIGFYQSPAGANLAITADGKMLIAVNIYDQSISLIDTQSNTVSSDYDLRPYNTEPKDGNGKAGGETPLGIAIKGSGTVYVSSVRDRQIVVLDISSGTPKLIRYIPTKGNPNAMSWDGSGQQKTLYVSEDNADQAAAIDADKNQLVWEIDARGPPNLLAADQRYTGAGSNAVVASPDGKRLYVTNGGQNALAVIDLTQSPPAVVGLVPTGWWPSSVAVTEDGNMLYVVNTKSEPGPNPQHFSGSTSAMTQNQDAAGNGRAAKAAFASNQYVLQLEHAGLLTLPAPGNSELPGLTSQVAANNNYSSAVPPSDRQIMSFLHAHIHHVIYMVKENRTFDQLFGDLTNGANADPRLVQFGSRITPNFHAIQSEYVCFDNFYDPAEVSGDGWQWSVAGRETDLNAKQIPIDYASSPTPNAINQGGRGAPYNAEGQDNNVDVGRPTIASRAEAQPSYRQVTQLFPGGADNFFPGTNSDVAPDGPDGEKQMGYIWNAVLKAGLSIRNYGFYIDLSAEYANVEYPFRDHQIQAWPSNQQLDPFTDKYFRSFDNAYPDFWRYKEWKREFDQFVADGKLPALSLVRLMHDHMGSFSTAVGGINTPERQQADNDFAVAKVIEAVANSPYRNDTLIVAVEDDSQDGPDHVDAHRSMAYFVGPYVAHRKLVHTFYTTIDVLRTIEDILGTGHLNLNDAYAQPMADAFDVKQPDWNFKAEASPFLAGTTDVSALDVRYSDNFPAIPTHDAAWWAKATSGMNWSQPDRVPFATFNRILWEGMKGTPYPVAAGSD